MNWRTATTTVETSAGILFQSAYVDESGNIVSFASGETRVDKYWDSTKAQAIYKKIPSPLFFVVGNTKSWTWDGSSLTEYAHSALDTTYLGAVMFRGSYYVIDSSGNLWKSSNLTSWTDTTEDASTISTDGNTLAITYPSSTTIRYTNDGVTWNTHNSWTSSPAPVQINAIRWLDTAGKWVAVGYVDDTGSSGNFKPWTAEVNGFGGVWSDYALTSSGDGDTSFLDVAYAAGSYRMVAYVGANNSYLNFYSSSSVDSFGQFPDTYSAESTTTYLARTGFTATDRPVATPNWKIVSPMAGYEYFLNGNSTLATWQCFPPAQDKNGEAYVITWDNNSSSTNFDIRNSSDSIIATLPDAGYIIGGYR